MKLEVTNVLGILGIFESDETESLRFSFSISHYGTASDLSIVGEQLLETVSVEVFSKVLYKHIGESFVGSVTHVTKSTRLEFSNEAESIDYKNKTYTGTNTFFPASSIPFTFWMAFCAASSVSKWTNP